MICLDGYFHRVKVLCGVERALGKVVDKHG